MLMYVHRYTQSVPKIRKTDNLAFPSSALFPKLVNRAALLIIIPAMGNILVIADDFFLQGAIMIAPFFNVIITAFTHLPNLLRLNACPLTVITDAAVIHAPCSTAPAANRIAADTQLFCPLISYESHDLSLLFFFFRSKLRIFIPL